jgi:phospholipid/cholesterol/gamma-HCH transport system substrate-binding protein
MPRTRSLAWSELKIGLAFIVAVVLAGIMIFLLGGEGGFFWQRYSLKTVFTNVAGLGSGAPVRVAGLEVGTVESVKFVGDRVEITMQVKKDQQPRITDTSVASLGSVSLLGESAVDITPSSKGHPVPEWGYVPAAAPASTIADVTNQASVGMQQITALVTDIRSGRGTMGQLFTNESLYRDLNGLIASVEEVAKNVNGGKGTLGRLASDPTAAKALEDSLLNLQEMTAKIRSGEGNLGKLLGDDKLATSLTSTSSNLDGITGKINRGEGTVGKALTDTALYDHLDSMTDRLDKVIAALQTGEGTAGQFLQDKRFYENMNATAEELRKLVADIRADPKKYLNVRVSIF